MMYEPKQTEIDDKVAELLNEAIADDELLIDALIHCLPQITTVYRCDHVALLDAVSDLKVAIDKYLITYFELEKKATDALIAEVGYVKQTDVDDFKFVTHRRDEE